LGGRFRKSIIPRALPTKTTTNYNNSIFLNLIGCMIVLTIFMCKFNAITITDAFKHVADLFCTFLIDIEHKSM